MERVFILIDGSNFFHRLRETELKNLLRFDYRAFTNFLLRKNREATIQTYYIGAVREELNNPKSKELMRNQRTLIENLRKHGWKIGFGHMLKDNAYHEKGVDVLMAVDLVCGAYENLYDTAILVSSDTDLIPALDKVRSKGKRVEYIGFSHKPSMGLIVHSDIRRLLTKEDLQQFLPRS